MRFLSGISCVAAHPVNYRRQVLEEKLPIGFGRKTHNRTLPQHGLISTLSCSVLSKPDFISGPVTSDKFLPLYRYIQEKYLTKEPKFTRYLSHVVFQVHISFYDPDMNEGSCADSWFLDIAS